MKKNIKKRKRYIPKTFLPFFLGLLTASLSVQKGTAQNKPFSPSKKGKEAHLGSAPLFATKEEKLEQKRKEEALAKIASNNFIQSFVPKANIPFSIDSYIETEKKFHATIIGPLDTRESIFLEKKVYLQWSSTRRPEVGDVFDIFEIGTLFQNRENLDEFRIISSGSTEKAPDMYSTVGYYYKVNGKLKITSTSLSTIEATITMQKGTISLGQKIGDPRPRYSNIEPNYNPLSVRAAIVAGDPPSRIRADIGSVIFLHAGSRQGVEIGNVFQTVERVYLADGTSIGKNAQLGKAMVIYTSEYFSTAIIIEQFDSIRIGTLMELAKGPEKTQDVSGRTTKTLSRLDRIERNSKILELSQRERKRLEKLYEQEKQEEERASSPASSVAPPRIYQEERGARSRPTQKETDNSEEALNRLFSQ